MEDIATIYKNSKETMLKIVAEQKIFKAFISENIGDAIRNFELFIEKELKKRGKNE